MLFTFFSVGGTLNQFSEDELSAQEMIDFSPIYRCLHISTVLGSRTTFETYYRTERTKQARLVLQPPTNMVTKTFCHVIWWLGSNRANFKLFFLSYSI